MYKTKKIIPFVIILIILYVILVVLNKWLTATMPRHQLIQLPSAFVLGYFSYRFLFKIKISDNGSVISVIIFVIASIIFWNIPRSIDYAIIYRYMNIAMIINMFVCGYLLKASLLNTSFEIKIAFWGMLSAMLLASGMVLHTFNILICSVFNLQQQQETGLYLILIGLTSLLFVIIYMLSYLSKINHK